MTDEPIRLRGAQRAIRDAYVAHDAGLFTLDCVPGSGKSVVAYHLAAEELLTRYVNGDRTPEQHVAVVSFTRGEAADIVPAIRDRLRTIVDHELVPAADRISDRELEYLAQRVQRASFAGTIDGVLRTVFEEIAHDVGFEGMPAVGSEARLRRVHTACYETVRRDPALTDRLSRLEAAYPDEEYRDGVADLLETAVAYCRDRRLSTADVRRELERTIESVYPGGQPASGDDVLDAIRRFVGGDVDVGSDVDPDVDPDADMDGVDEGAGDAAPTDADRRHVVAADARLHEEWVDRVDDFCAVLSGYREAYRDAIRDRGVVSHTDVAALIDAYFEGRIGDENDENRVRVRERYRTRMRSLIIDEAQDVSAIQHAALAHLVTTETRVFCSGDLLQSIYRWRNADPELFESAIRDGRYLGVEWDTHEHWTATTTYRCRPDVAAAISAIADPVLTDPDRGDIGDLDVTYPGLDAFREPTAGTNVHIAAFDPMHSDPDSYTWCRPVEGRGEAEAVATLVSKGLGDGTFTDGDGEPLDIDVLFRWSSRMEAYEEAFAEAGLRVRNASRNLFACDAVDAVLAVCEWLIAPADPARTRRLLTEDPIDDRTLADAVDAHDGALGHVLDACDLSTAQGHLLEGLATLRRRRDAVLSRPASTYVEDVIEALGLRADPADLAPDRDAAQRVANLDALTATIAQWEADDHLPPRELTDLVDPFRDSPRLGPSQPSVTGADHDVEFRTIHDAKGDEADVVVLANPGFEISRNGVRSNRSVTQGTRAALAPPTNVDVSIDVSLPGYRNGIYDPSDTRDPDVGLRWMTARWRDDVVDVSINEAGADLLVGPDRLRRVAANDRAEEWRLLYVALTRTRDHLVVPLPGTVPYDPRPRDRWLDTIRQQLGFSTERTGTYTLDSASGTAPIDIGVNDVALGARWTPDGTPTRADADVAVTPPRTATLEPWLPRFLRPSTLHPLTERPDEYVIPHLLGNALHTAANDVPADHPLPFDRLGPGDVGRCLHDVLTTLIDRSVSGTTIRERDAIVREIFDETLTETAPHVGADERDALFGFLDRAVLDDFVASDLWALIGDAETVRVEQPVDGLATIGDVEVEIHGTADVVVETPAGERHVADLKISLAALTSDTRKRYELQVATYAFLFERQSSGRGVHRSVETFGRERETITSPWPPSVVEHRLSRLDR
ncbi:ATP-dependent helicase/nuclease subunit A [Halopenitus malekzadehii]|uniref:DNA 3'-5' helicase n=1 Tax=Halopenitus malekzadehii TaxID=1267564 RepID=A0A1H6ICN9_9EURY|nr:UvrD-helicase domain-containing protein [Halopenitus malekzadehii]SEH46124.1 ATP-dependent helicase/nuclease subunit A [Halopenitus malekzadehii]